MTGRAAGTRMSERVQKCPKLVGEIRWTDGGSAYGAAVVRVVLNELRCKQLSESPMFLSQ